MGGVSLRAVLPALPSLPGASASVAAGGASQTGEVVDTRRFDPGTPIVLPLVVLTVISWAAVGVSPWLIQWPLLLIALNPRMIFLMLVAPKLGLLEFTLVATLRLCVADPLNYLLGVRYGGRMRDRIERTRIRRWLLRITPIERRAVAIALWIRPSQSVLAWAGSIRLSPKYVAVTDVITTVAYVVAIHQGLSFLT